MNRIRLAAIAAAPLVFAAPPAAAQIVSERDVARAIGSYGFGVYRIVRREPGRTAVEACRDGRKFRLDIDGRGQVRSRGDVGRCDLRVARTAGSGGGGGRNGLPLPQIRERLRQLGFTRIEFTDRQLPGYGATVCAGDGRRLTIRMNRRGEIRRSENAGRCGPQVTTAQLEERLRNDGLLRVGVNRDGNGYVATACDGPRQVRISFDRRGRATGRQRLGPCESRTVLEIVRSICEAGASQIDVRVRACINNTRYVYDYNPRGDGLGRRAVGNC